MTHDNHLLGKLELTGLPPAPRGVPQIEVSFEVDRNGLLVVSATDKATGKGEQITITAEHGRLSDTELEHMLKEAELKAEDDRLLGVQARNSLETYAYHLRNSLHGGDTDEEGSTSSSMTAIHESDKRELLNLVDETLDWLEVHQAAEKDEFEDKLKEMQQLVNPILKGAYSSAGNHVDEEFGDGEL